MTHSTKDKLIYAASGLFRKKGYEATGLTEILQTAGVPKGSLYHHFPGGKPDLALAAAKWAGAYMCRVIDASFVDAETFEAGIEKCCNQLAEILDKQNAWDFCPITSTLLDGPSNESFRKTAKVIFQNWQDVCIAHAIRFKLSPKEAKETAGMLLMLLEGAWILSRSEGNSEPFRNAAKFYNLKA